MRTRKAPRTWVESVLCRPRSLSKPAERAASNTRPSSRPSASCSSNRVIEAGIGKVEGEQVLPVDPRPHGLGGLAVAQTLTELHEDHQSQAPCGVTRLASHRVEVGEIVLGEHRTDLVRKTMYGVPPGNAAWATCAVCAGTTTLEVLRGGDMAAILPPRNP